MPVSELTMTMPAQTRFISTARVTAASIAAELDFSIDEIEEFQMGANELITVLVEVAEDHGVDSIELQYRVNETSVEVFGTVPALPSGVAIEFDVLATQILKAVVDDFGIEGSTARLSKRRVEA